MLTLLPPSSFLPVAHQPSGLLYSQRSWVGKEKAFQVLEHPAGGASAGGTCWSSRRSRVPELSLFCAPGRWAPQPLPASCITYSGKAFDTECPGNQAVFQLCVYHGRQDSLTADSVTCPGLRNLRPLNLRFDSSLEFSQQSEPDLSLCWPLPPFFPLSSYSSLLSLAITPLPLPLPSPALVTSELFNYVFSWREGSFLTASQLGWASTKDHCSIVSAPSFHTSTSVLGAESRQETIEEKPLMRPTVATTEEPTRGSISQRPSPGSLSNLHVWSEEQCLNQSQCASHAN